MRSVFLRENITIVHGHSVSKIKFVCACVCVCVCVREREMVGNFFSGLSIIDICVLNLHSLFYIYKFSFVLALCYFILVVFAWRIQVYIIRQSCLLSCHEHHVSVDLT